MNIGGRFVCALPRNACVPGVLGQLGGVSKGLALDAPESRNHFKSCAEIVQLKPLFKAKAVCCANVVNAATPC